MSGCGFTPSTCMDDICRWSAVGLCGNEEPSQWETAVDDDWPECDDGPIEPNSGGDQ